ncbi:hypothetical protein IPM65_02380 [Candidatus Roizmanbacteria bacterium]|nr:MAG: hypothetical protein IPM65_02380 [Candidatus Roizmanbacteria bacterium]
MSEIHPIIQTIENNDEAYILWKDHNIKNAIVLHIDAHLDYRNDRAGLHIGNYLKHAVKEHLAKTIYWIVPGSGKQFTSKRQAIKQKLRSAGIHEEIVQAKSGLTTLIDQTRLIVCPLGLLPKTIEEPYVIDIDLDFMFFSSCLTADRVRNIGKRSPWISTEYFAKTIKPLVKSAALTTLCYSTTGGWTPMRYRHFGDQILHILGTQKDSIHQRIIAGNFFTSFWKYFKDNTLQQAKKYYQSALALNPTYASFFMTDGPLFILKGDLRSARTEFSRLQQIDPQNIYAIFGLGLVELLSGNLTKAKVLMEKARSITSNKEIVLFLIYIQSQLGEHEMVQELLTEYKKSTFPEKPLPTNVLNGILHEIAEKLKTEHQIKNIGQMYLYPNPHAVTVWKRLAEYSSNNIGNWTEEPESLRHTAAAIELDLIEKMVDLYFENPAAYGGYMTSGATEGNIFSAWLGRKYLEKKPVKSPIILLANDLAHYSIFKAADVTGLTVQSIPVNTKDWNTDTDKLIKTVVKLKKKGISKFLIPLTLGYTVGGTNDDVQTIVQELRRLKEKMGIEYFLWIDAALSGLTIPFLKNDYRSYFSQEIHTVVVDFHKALGVPMPAGFVLYRKELAGPIKTTIPYLSTGDSTLLGSRNGIAPIAAWMSIHQYGFTKLSRILKKEIHRKNRIISEVRRKFPDARVITDSDSLHAAILVHEALPQSFCTRYGLHLRKYTINNKEYLLYPLFFMPRWDQEYASGPRE